MTDGCLDKSWKQPHVYALALALSFAFATVSWAQTPRIVAEGVDSKHAGEVVVPINKSQILQVDVPFKEVLVGNPEIADVLPLTDRSIYILGKSLGSTNLTIYGNNKQLIAVADLVISLDVDGLKARLYEILPGETVEVRPANNSVILTGSVSSAIKINRILAIAEQYAPEHVTNLLSVKGSQQVMLEVRFSEVARSASKALGLNTSIAGNKFHIVTGDSLKSSLATNLTTNSVSVPIFPGGLSLTGQIPSSTFTSGLLGFTPGSISLDFLFDALEEKGVVKTLAEPNLIAMSGDTASFLAGGEFPVPVVQSSRAGGAGAGGQGAGGTAAITIQFKEFGVALAFTPTVLDNGLINLVVSPEVSRLDFANAVFVSGFRIPALTTRRATTTVELRDGQSFAIAGLIQNEFQDAVRQFPGLGDLPIIGALLRSSDFQRNESELVIIVTPHLVKPAPAGSLATPDENFIPPSDGELFFLGATEAGQNPLMRTLGNDQLSRRGAGGIDGDYGHIVK